jgi:hypothetical protein
LLLDKAELKTWHYGFGNHIEFMKRKFRRIDFSACCLARVLVVAGCLFWTVSGLAQSPPADDGGPTNVPLASWSFQDTTNWTSDQGYWLNPITILVL